MGCPNKNSKEFRMLAAQLGSEQSAVYTWKALGENYPKTFKSLTQLKKEIGVRDNLSSLAKALLAKRVAAYNAKNGTSHSFKATRIGESRTFKIEFAPSYLSVGALQRQQTLFEENNLPLEASTKNEGVNTVLYKRSANEYIVNGEVYSTYEDAQAALDNEGLLYQNKQGARGAFDTLNSIIYALSNPDITTFPHELAHAWENQLTQEERQTILDWTGTETWTRETSEKFAKGFEVFLAEGNQTGNPKMDGLFQKFAKWLADMYQQLKESLGIELNDQMRGVYSAMLNSQYVKPEVKETVKQAEEALVEQVSITEQTPIVEGAPILETKEATTTEVIPPKYEIVLQLGISGENEITVIDEFGDLVLNPDNDFGTFDTREEAQAFIDRMTAQEQQGVVEEEQVVVEKPVVETNTGITINDVQIQRSEEITIIEYNGQEIGAYYEQNGLYVDANAKRSQAVAKPEVEVVADILNKYNKENPVQAQPVVTEQVVLEQPTLQKGALTPQDVSVPKKPDENGEYPVTNKANGVVIGYMYEQDGEWIDPTMKANDPNAYLGDTKKEATQAILDRYNEENNLITEGQYGNEYYSFELGRGASRKRIVGLLLDTKEDPKNPARAIYTLQDIDGNIFDINDKKENPTLLQPTTEQDFDNQEPLQKPKPKYNVGTEITDAEGNKHVVESIEIKLIPNTTNFDVIYNTFAGPINEQDVTKGTAIKDPIKKAEFRNKQHKEFNDKLQRIAQRFQNLFGDTILFETGYYEFDAPARFYKGKVQVNLDYVNSGKDVNFNEAVAHEFMHPFVLALKLSNRELYNNLVNELKDKHQGIIKEVRDNPNYDPKELYDEALTIYLGRELSKAFNEDGSINIDYVADRTIFGSFLDWLRDIVDFLLGKRKPKTLDQFVKDVNIDRAQQVENTKKEIKRLEDEYPEFKKLLSKQKQFDRKASFLLKNKEAAKGVLPSEEYDNLYTRLEDYQDEVTQITPRFEFIIAPNSNSYVSFDTTNPSTIKVYVDPSVGLSISNIANILLQNKNKLGDAELIDEYTDLVGRNFYIDTSKVSKKVTRKELEVSQIDPTLQLQQVSDFILYQISDLENRQRANEIFTASQERELTPQEVAELNNLNNQHTATGVTITFTENEMSAIDNLEAYMSLGKETAKKTRERILKKMPLLKESADVRFKSPSLRINYNVINALNRDVKDDTEFVLQYFEEASRSITAAYRKYYEIVEDVRKRQGQISKAELARLNREFRATMQLLAFYEEFDRFTSVEFDFKNTEEAKLHAQLHKTKSYMGLMRDGMHDTAINLTIEWLSPYMEEHNRYMAKEGYTEEKYLLTRDLLYEHFKYGKGEDISHVTYWLGANISSRNQINALFANTLSDAISFNNIDTFQDSTTINVAYQDFLTKTGISNSNRKAQEEYYKKHYMRQAVIPYRQYDPITDDYTDTTTTKWALHQEFYWDKYQLDLDEIEKKYSNPKNEEEELKFKEKIRAWKTEQGFTATKEGVAIGLTNPKYINKEYQKLKGDKFFKVLEQYYNQGNDRYGNNRLRYGIIPQKYDQNFWEKLKNLVGEVKDENTIKEKYEVVKQNIRDTFGPVNNNVEQYNLDGTFYKSINTTLTTIKNEENLSFNLQEILIDFTVESRKYSVLKETQHHVDTLMMLLEGNEKFNIKAREFASKDYNRKLTSSNKLDAARKKLKELDEAKARGEKIDEDYYKKVQERIEKGVEEVSVWDKLAKKWVPARTNRANETLINQINEYYYGIQPEDFVWKDISAAKLAHYVSLYTSINSMALNVTAAIGNVSIGSTQMFIEAHGGKYYNKKQLAAAYADYMKNVGSYLSDLQKPIKSKDSQLAIMLDAIQGEIENEFGQKVTGNLARKFFDVGSFFFLTSAGEHVLQTVNMKAMMAARKVKTNAGETISLYDAFVADKDGRYSLRKDIDFTEADLSKFMRDLHGVNRDLNGNYSEFNKVELQRKWYGNLAMKFRKYMYSTYRSRWSTERVNYEKNTVEVGYLRYFYGTYLYGHMKNLLTKGKLADTKGMKPHEVYALRKATMETGIYVALGLLALAMFGGDEDKKKKLSPAEKQLLYYMLRLRGDLQVYNGGLPNILTGQAPTPLEEPLRQLKNPTASMRTVVDLSKAVQQLFDYDEVYKQSGPGYSKGDNKLYKRVMKLVPGRQFVDMLNGEFEENIDAKLGYFELVNKNIEGVSPRQSTQ